MLSPSPEERIDENGKDSRTERGCTDRTSGAQQERPTHIVCSGVSGQFTRGEVFAQLRRIPSFWSSLCIADNGVLIEYPSRSLPAAFVAWLVCTATTWPVELRNTGLPLLPSVTLKVAIIRRVPARRPKPATIPTRPSANAVAFDRVPNSTSG